MWKQKLLIYMTSSQRTSTLYSTPEIQRNYCYIPNLLIVCCQTICKGCCPHCFWMHLFLLNSGALIFGKQFLCKKNLIIIGGVFNNYVTLKLTFLTHPTSPSRFITNDLKTPHYVTSRLMQIPPLSLISFFKLKKNRKDTHPPMTYSPMF